MKILNRLLIVIFCMALFYSCSEPDEFLDEAPVMLKKAMIKVQPSNEPNVQAKADEDWKNITDALQDAGPGETVMLGEGIFYLRKSVVVWNFNGTLRGTGRNKTIIQTAPGEIFDRSASPALDWSFELNDGHFMICFPHHNNLEKRTVIVSDLKIVINEPCDTYKLRDLVWGGEKERNTLQAINVHYENLVGGAPGSWGDLTLLDKIDLNVLFKNITVIGEEGSEYMGSGYSVKAGLTAFGASTGKFEAKNIYMENVANGMLLHAFCGDNSRVTVKNVKIENTPAAIYSFLVPSFDIKNNEFKNVKGLALDLFSNNPMVTFDMPTNLSSFIANNLFMMDGTEAAIFGGRIHNANVYNNTFTGTSSTGIQLNFGAPWEVGNCSNWSIKNNDMCDLNVTNGATIMLHKAVDCEVKNNAYQIVGGSSADDPTNVISNPKECN